MARDEKSSLAFLTRRVAVLGVIYSLGGFIYGYDTGQVSGFLEMDNFKRSFGSFDTTSGNFSISTTQSGLIVGLLSIGNLVGALIAGPLADRFGRKLPMRLACLSYMIGAIVQISSSRHWYQVALGRGVGGIGVGGLSVLVPVASSESSPAKVRGLVVSGFQMSVTLGICMASLINLGTERLHSTAAWRITIGLDFLWATLLIIGLRFVPESPKYVLRIGLPEQARDIMASLLGVDKNNPVLAQEMNEMEASLRAEQSHKTAAPWWDMFRSREVRLRTLLATGILSFQQLTGANFFFYYGTSVFAATGISNSYITQAILGAVNVVCTLPGLYFAQQYSRKRCLVAGALWMALFFIVYASVGEFALDHEDPQRTQAAGAILITSTALFIAGFASTWGPISWGEAALVCPAQCRASSASIATAAYWMWSFLLAYFTPAITARIGYLYGYTFSGCCIAMALMAHFTLIESQGRSLEELDLLYRERYRQGRL